MLADISQFQSFCSSTSVPVWNSDATPLLHKFGKLQEYYDPCTNTIAELQQSQLVPISFLNDLYECLDKYDNELSKLRQEIGTQLGKEPLDSGDRREFIALPQSAQDALRDIITAQDEVFRRMMAMKGQGSMDTTQAPVEAGVPTELPAQTGYEPAYPTAGGYDEGFASDIASEE